MAKIYTYMKPSLSPAQTALTWDKLIGIPQPSALAAPETDLESTLLALERRMWHALYLGLSVSIAALYFFHPGRPGFCEKLFCMLVPLYALCKARWAVDFFTVPSLQLWAILECILYFPASCLLSSDFPAWQIGNATLVPFMCALVSTKLLPMACVSVYAAAWWTWHISEWRLAGSIFAVQSVFLFALNYRNSLIMQLLGITHETWKHSEEKTRNNGLFLASVSHDLKNPLNAILNSVDMIKETATNLSETERKSLMTASYSGQVLRYLIGNILDITKIGEGKFSLNMAPFSILDEVRKIVRIERELARPKSVSLYKRIFTAVPSLVIGDAMRLTQVLINLVGNAIKFTSRGYVAVLIRWARNAQESKENFLVKLFQSKMLLQLDSDILIPPEEYFIIGTRSSIVTPHKKQSTILAATPASRQSDRPTFNAANTPINDETPHFDEEQNEEFFTTTNPNNDRVETRKELPPAFNALLMRKLSRSHPMILTSSDHIIQLETIQRIEHSSSMYCVVEQESECEPGPAAALEPVPESTFEDKGFLVIDVIDTGIGMSQEEVARLFQPFSQANSSVQGQFGGTGLGLWIAKQLVTLMHGEIEVRSDKGRGSVFTVTLPFDVGKADQDSPRKLVPASADRTSPTARDRERRSARTSKGFKKSVSRDMCAFRMKEKLVFTKASGFVRKMIRIMVLEHRGYEDDYKLEQVVKQLKKLDCTAYYTTYDNADSLAQDEKFDFGVIVVLASTQVPATKAVVLKLRQMWQASLGKKAQVIILTGKPSTM